MIPVFLKSLAKSRFAAFLASGLVWLYVGLMRLFSRIGGAEITTLRAAEKQGAGVICAFWHERLILAPVMAKFAHKPVHMLISMNRDGDIMARGVKVRGVSFIRGSASNPLKRQKDKSGAPALIQLIAALKGGDIVAMTPDGPRGPARKPQIGVIKLAARTGAPVLPTAFSASGGQHLNSWDRSYLANPFSRKTVLIGTPI